MLTHRWICSTSTNNWKDKIMDEFLRGLARDFPEIQGFIDDLMAGRITPEFFSWLIPMLARLVGDRAAFIRFIAWLSRAGYLQGVNVIDAQMAAEMAAAEAEGAVEVVVVGGAEGTAAAGTTAVAATAAVALVTVIIVAGCLYRIYSVNKQASGMAPMQPSGSPCKGDPSMGVEEFHVKGWSVWGGPAAFDETMKLAQAECAKKQGRCTGNCAGGKKCQPNVSVQTATPGSYVIYSDVDMTFRCPCECL
jgi:hypothetical protein